MPDPRLIASISHFLGINTVDEPIRLATTTVKTPAGYKAAYPLVEAVNVDIDDAYSLSSRDGSDLKLAGTDMHSLWADDDICLFVDGQSLYFLYKDYSSYLLMSGLNRRARMSYVKVNNRVYMTNGTYIGYYENIAMHALNAPVKNFKAALPAGQFIGYYKTRVLIGKEKVLYIGDALCDHYDIRDGFRQFATNIQMIQGVGDGVYVSDCENTYFLATKRDFADDPDELKRNKIMDCPAIPYSDTSVHGSKVGDGTGGDVAVWSCKWGVIMGDQSGKISQVTPKYLMASTYGRGSAAVREISGIVHYLATLE